MATFERDYFEKHASYGQAGGYSALADRSGEYYEEYFRIAAQAVPAIMHGNGGRAIEIGCAFGSGCLWLRNHGWNVIASDVSSYACERARERLPADIPVRQLDIRDGVPEAPFDLVACIQVIEHVEGASFTEALAQLVAPGGTLVVATPNPRSISPYRKFQADPTHINEQPVGHWRGLLERFGLTVRAASTYHVVPFLSRKKIRYVRVPEAIGYDSIIVATRPA